MARENHSQYAILGLLTADCRTGYSIKQMIDTSLNHFWKISYEFGLAKALVKKAITPALSSVRQRLNKQEQSS